jgi:formylglycine-generating enzyme
MGSFSFPLPQRARIAPLPQVFPFAWAVEIGEDRYGMWQAFEVGGSRQVLRWIPSGHFMMGSPATEQGRGGDESMHLVNVKSGHWLADTTCTQALWSAVMNGANPSGFVGDAQSPVEQVSWMDVTNDFLPNLNACVPGLGAELPTEAQWEYACRADAIPSTPFSFGQSINTQQVNFDPMDDNIGANFYRGATVPVKALGCNAWGLYQMHGNVWEWTRSPNPTEFGIKRCARGGSFQNTPRHCRSAERRLFDATEFNNCIGFRISCSDS